MKDVRLSLIIVVLCSLCSAWSSCKEFIEPSLEKRVINPKAPSENYQSPKYTITFWWDGLEDATSYQLQVVTPDFKFPGSLLLDTVVSKESFSFNLDPGNYQWRVRALNGSSQTAFSNALSFTVLQSSIKQQSVQLVGPANNAVTNQKDAIFQWGSLYGATKYHFQIDTSNFANENTLVYDASVPGQQINFTFLKDQSYQWRVRAENDTAQARWSSVYQVTYDHTPPPVVTPVSPVANTTVSKPVTLQWSAVASAVKYKVYVLKADSTSAYNQNFPVTLNNTTSYSFTGGNPGEKIYWQVSALDAAGNEGEKSKLRNFLIQQ
ncbi:MAG: hypothetical protein V4456_16365 [Bacteroidota bacterium]